MIETTDLSFSGLSTSVTTRGGNTVSLNNDIGWRTVFEGRPFYIDHGGRDEEGTKNGVGIDHESDLEAPRPHFFFFFLLLLTNFTKMLSM